MGGAGTNSRGLLRGEATAFQAAKVGSTPTVRSIPPAPPVTRWGFIIDAESRKCDSENVTCFRYRHLQFLRSTDLGLSTDTKGHNPHRLVLGSFCGPFNFMMLAEISMDKAKDAHSKAYTDFIRFPRTEREVSKKLGLPLWRVIKTLHILRALSIATQQDDGKWVKSDWPIA